MDYDIAITMIGTGRKLLQKQLSSSRTSDLSMRTQWCSTSWSISGDEIAMDVTYQEAREHDNLEEGKGRKRRRKDDSSSHAPMVRNPIKVSRVLELLVGREVPRTGLTGLRASFTVSQSPFHQPELCENVVTLDI